MFKGQRPTLAGSWSTGGNINAARYVPGGGGSKTASIMFGGQPGGDLLITQNYIMDRLGQKLII